MLLEKYKEQIKIMKYFTEDDKATIENELQKKQIIVATNLAGRGTDIKISKELEGKGGLHVIVSFFPLNGRVERQNYGRAGRNGQRGTYILIMKYDNEYGPLEDNKLNIKYLEKLRDEEEYNNIKEMLGKEKIFMDEKEELFIDFCDYKKKNYEQENKFVTANIEEQWGIIIKSKDINTIKEKYKRLKKEDNKEIKNKLISIKKMCNYSEIDRTIFELEPKYSWNARVRLACCLAKKNVPKNSDLSDKEEAIDHFEMAKKIINDDFLEDLSIQSVLNDMVFSSYALNREKKRMNLLRPKFNFKMKKEKTS
jgi:superfamily II DNA/RNA helicase